MSNERQEVWLFTRSTIGRRKPFSGGRIALENAVRDFCYSLCLGVKVASSTYGRAADVWLAEELWRVGSLRRHSTSEPGHDTCYPLCFICHSREDEQLFGNFTWQMFLRRCHQHLRGYEDSIPVIPVVVLDPPKGVDLGDAHGFDAREDLYYFLERLRDDSRQ